MSLPTIEQLNTLLRLLEPLPNAVHELNHTTAKHAEKLETVIKDIEDITQSTKNVVRNEDLTNFATTDAISSLAQRDDLAKLEQDFEEHDKHHSSTGESLNAWKKESKEKFKALENVDKDVIDQLKAKAGQQSFDKFKQDTLTDFDALKRETTTTIDKFKQESATDFDRFKQETTATVDRFKQESATNFDDFKQETTTNVDKFKQETTTDFDGFKQETTATVDRFKQESATNFDRFKQETTANFDRFKQEIATDFDGFKREVSIKIAANVQQKEYATFKELTGAKIVEFDTFKKDTEHRGKATEERAKSLETDLAKKFASISTLSLYTTTSDIEKKFAKVSDVEENYAKLVTLKDYTTTTDLGRDFAKVSTLKQYTPTSELSKSYVQSAHFSQLRDNIEKNFVQSKELSKYVKSEDLERSFVKSSAVADLEQKLVPILQYNALEGRVNQLDEQLRDAKKDISEQQRKFEQQEAQHATFKSEMMEILSGRLAQYKESQEEKVKNLSDQLETQKRTQEEAARTMSQQLTKEKELREETMKPLSEALEQQMNKTKQLMTEQTKLKEELAELRSQKIAEQKAFQDDLSKSTSKQYVEQTKVWADKFEKGMTDMGKKVDSTTNKLDNLEDRYSANQIVLGKKEKKLEGWKENATNWVNETEERLVTDELLMEELLHYVDTQEDDQLSRAKAASKMDSKVKSLRKQIKKLRPRVDDVETRVGEQEDLSMSVKGSQSRLEEQVEAFDHDLDELRENQRKQDQELHQMLEVPSRLDQSEKIQEKFEEDLAELQERTLRRVRYETFKQECAKNKSSFDDIHRQLEDRRTHSVRREGRKMLEYDPEPSHFENNGSEDNLEVQGLVIDHEQNEEEETGPTNFRVEDLGHTESLHASDTFDEFKNLDEDQEQPSTATFEAEAEDDGDAEDFAVWLDEQGDLQTDLKDLDGSWHELQETWASQKAEFVTKAEDTNVNWLELDINKNSAKCLRTVMFPRTQRWTKSGSGAYACKTCVNTQRICFGDHDGRLTALPLLSEAIKQNRPNVLQRFVAQVPRVTRAYHCTHLWQD